MPEYRLYCLNDGGKFTKSHEITAASDEAAIEAAREMKLGVSCELWNHKRFVAELPPTRLDL